MSFTGEEYCFIKEAQDKFFATEQAHTKALNLVSRVLACHCECLGMIAENIFTSNIRDAVGMYPESAFKAVMQKWGLITEKGEPNL